MSLGHCLNLMDKSSNEPLSDAFRLVSGLFSDKGEQMPENVRKLHYRDALVVNVAHSVAEASGQPYDTVRAAFIEGSPVFDIRRHVLPPKNPKSIYLKIEGKIKVVYPECFDNPTVIEG